MYVYISFSHGKVLRYQLNKKKNKQKTHDAKCVGYFNIEKKVHMILNSYTDAGAVHKFRTTIN